MKSFKAADSLVPKPIPKMRKGSGDIGADSWFFKLSNRVIICIGLYCMCSHVMMCMTKKMPAMSPDPFLALVMGSGNETRCVPDPYPFWGWGLGMRLGSRWGTSCFRRVWVCRKPCLCSQDLTQQCDTPCNIVKFLGTQQSSD